MYVCVYSEEMVGRGSRRGVMESERKWAHLSARGSLPVSQRENIIGDFCHQTGDVGKTSKSLGEKGG